MLNVKKFLSLSGINSDSADLESFSLFELPSIVIYNFKLDF